MNINPMFEINKKILSSLPINPELDSYKLRVRKLLEFEVTLGELAKVTNCYSYLDNNTEDPCSDLVLEKYINCISNLITLGIEHNYDDITSINVATNDNCLSDQFLNLYIDINDLIVSPCRDHYITLFEDILAVGEFLGFSEDIIDEKFKLRNKN